MTTLIIADSRGRGIQDIMDTLSPNPQAKVLVHPGSGCELAVLKSIITIRDMAPELIVVFCGICDLTWRNKSTKKVNLRYRDATDNVTHVMEAVRSSYDLLRAEGSFRIAYATVTGLDITDYNNARRRHMTDDQYREYCETTKVAHPDQLVLNQAILTINKNIVVFNKRNRTKTVWTAGLVHSYIKKTYHNYYRRLFDGCHPDEKTKNAWAAQLNKSITRIIATPTRKTHAPTEVW